MKKTILDYFKKSYDAKLSVNARELDCVPDQLRGVAASLNDGRDIVTEEVRAMIRELRPKIMRLYPADANYQAWLDFCLAEEINPHVVLSADDAADAIHGRSRRCGRSSPAPAVFMNSTATRIKPPAVPTRRSKPAPPY